MIYLNKWLIFHDIDLIKAFILINWTMNDFLLDVFVCDNYGGLPRIQALLLLFHRYKWFLGYACIQNTHPCFHKSLSRTAVRDCHLLGKYLTYTHYLKAHRTVEGAIAESSQPDSAVYP